MVVGIIRCGSYLPVGADSFFLNTLSVSNIQESWSIPVDSVINTYVSILGRDNLYGIYLRGSVAKGTAVDYVSDIDSVAILRSDIHIDPHLFNSSNKLIISESPFVKKIENICIFEKNFFLADSYRYSRLLMATESVCLWGNNIVDHLPRYKLDRNFINLLPLDLEKHIYKMRSEFVFSSPSSEYMYVICIFLMKKILRQAMNMLVFKSGLYSRDLYLCYEVFSRYYPEKKSQMYEVLFYAINPSSDMFLVERILSGIGDWLVQESLLVASA